MKNLFKVGMVLLITAIVFGIGACTFEDDDPPPASAGIDWTSYSGTDIAIQVRNSTQQRLIAFKGTVHADNLIAGIPAGGGTPHGIGLAKNRKHFPSDKAVDFPMVLITEEQYNTNKANLAAIGADVFTRVYVFYNFQGDNTNIYEISAGLGGSQLVELVNTTNYNVELRVDGIQGATLGYAPSTMTRTNLRIAPGQYTLYPVFKYYNPIQQTVGSIFPTNQNNYYFSWTFAVTNNPSGPITLNLQTALGNSLQSRSLGAAWLIIDNQTNGAIEVMNGIEKVADALGFTMFNPGTEKVLQFNMAGTGGTFAQSRTIQAIRVTSVGSEARIRNKSDPNFVPKTSNNGDNDFNSSHSMFSLPLAIDSQYVVTVTGSHNDATGLIAEVVINDGVKIDFQSFTTANLQ